MTVLLMAAGGLALFFGGVYLGAWAYKQEMLDRMRVLVTELSRRGVDKRVVRDAIADVLENWS